MLEDIEKTIYKTSEILDIIKKFGFAGPVKVFFGTQEEIDGSTALQITAVSPEDQNEPLKMKSFAQVQLIELLGFSVIFKSSSNIGDLYIEHFDRYSANIQDVEILKEKLSATKFAEPQKNDFITSRLLVASKKHLERPSYKEKKQPGPSLFIKKKETSKKETKIRPEVKDRIISIMSELSASEHSKLLASIVKSYSESTSVDTDVIYQEKLLKISSDLMDLLQTDEKNDLIQP